MIRAICLMILFILLSPLLSLIGVHAIYLIILFILLGIWLLCYKKAHKFIINESKENYKNLERYIKKTKDYKRIAAPVNIIITVYLVYSIILILIMVLTLGILGLASPGTRGHKIYTAYCFNCTIFPYILIYIFIIKNIIFDSVLYKFFNNKTKNNTYTQTKRFCTNCGTEVTENFCTNCGKKA